MSSHTAPYTAKEIAEIRDRAQWCDGISAKCEAEHRWLATLDADRAEERALAVQAVRTRLGDKEGDALAALYAAFPTVPVGDARASRAGAQPVAWAVGLIAAERQRQQTVEGWTPAHDDEHGDGELAKAAACYADPKRPMRRVHHQPPRDPAYSFKIPAAWPWDAEWWKPGDRVRELVKAGALIVAEIERLQRASACRHDWDTDCRGGGPFCKRCGAGPLQPPLAPQAQTGGAL